MLAAHKTVRGTGAIRSSFVGKQERGLVPVTGPSVPDTGAIGARYRPSVPFAEALFNCLVVELSVTVPGF